MIDMIRPLGVSLFLGSLGLIAVTPSRADEPVPEMVRFNRDIRPILADHCYRCHGPDPARRKADLRLDLPASALADRGGYQVLTPGDPEASELIQRMSAEDPTIRMPPPEAGPPLNPRQIELLSRWIELGAAWEDHWAFVPPRSSPVPTTGNQSWPRNPIDHFILSRLEREGLTPSPETDRATLLRRLTLDLTGLPPSPREIDAFLADPTPDAYERTVDRLLASPRSGERMAVRWLDAARYADTNGYQSDGERFMWRWRDWVIAAYNRDMPFDQFTVEQIAGDLLPDPSLNQLIATGFNRNHRGNAEGGIIPEEYAAEYVVDRVETTATTLLGLTMGCARCHDHKYDPFTQHEFYRAFAFFNNVPEHGKAIKYGNSPPMIPAPTPADLGRLADLDRRLARAEAEFSAVQPALVEAQAQWEARGRLKAPFDWSISRGLRACFPLDGDVSEAAGRFEGGDPVFGPGRIDRAVSFDGSGFLDAGDVGRFGFYDPFTLAAWIDPADERAGPILSRMTPRDQADGYAVVLDGGKIQVNLVKRWLDDAIRVEAEHPLKPGVWHHVAVTYDGSRVAAGVRLFVDGRPEPLRVLLDELNQSFQSKEPFRIGAGGEGRFRGRIDDLRIYEEALSPEEIAILAEPVSVAEIASTSPALRSPSQDRKLAAFFLENDAPAPIREAWERLESLRRARAQMVQRFPTTMVMREMNPPRPTFTLIRGQYDRPGERVSPGVPACLPPLPDGVPANRLGLARWLVDPSNPLTARVAVNRAWQMAFGTGLVKTADDFGTQGEWPSHPELLDWLATEFVRDGWSSKNLLRWIVTSSTYRQSSRVTPELFHRDPENRLLARGPRLRLSAEMIRDQALAASGLLVERLGGPSVKPYQAPGLWKELTDADYDQGRGVDLYRRSLYTFWKRTIPPPTMVTFDAPGREACSVREVRTDTPLQALTLMNDVTFVEAARALAARVMLESGESPEARLTLAFRIATSRPPLPEELGLLLDGFRVHRDHYRRDPEAARSLLRVGDSPRDESLDLVDQAAYAAMVNAILCLDETVTKN